MLGPAAADLFWLDAVAKWQTRSASISSSGVCTFISVRLYNERAVAALSYLAQFSAIPIDICSEWRVLCRLLALPFTALSYAGLVNLWRWGAYRVLSIHALGPAIAWRASVRSISWADSWNVLSSSALENSSDLPLRSSLAGSPWEPWWSTQVPAAFLARSFAGVAVHAPIRLAFEGASLFFTLYC